VRGTDGKPVSGTWNGEPHLRQTETHEVIFAEGLEYRRLVARNGQPLSAREQAQVEKDMAQTAAERRKNLHRSPPQWSADRTRPVSQPQDGFRLVG
jgi:hypothetical protein